MNPRDAFKIPVPAGMRMFTPRCARIFNPIDLTRLLREPLASADHFHGPADVALAMSQESFEALPRIYSNSHKPHRMPIRCDGRCRPSDCSDFRRYQTQRCVSPGGVFVRCLNSEGSSPIADGFSVGARRRKNSNRES